MKIETRKTPKTFKPFNLVIENMDDYRLLIQGLSLLKADRCRSPIEMKAAVDLYNMLYDHMNTVPKETK